MKKLLEAMKEFDKNYNELKKELDGKLEAMAINYGKDGKFYTEMKEKLESEFEENVLAGRNDVKQAFKTSFADLKNKVNEYVVAPVPADLVSYLQIMKVSGASLDDTEAQLLLNKYQGSYIAKKAIYSFLSDNSFMAAHFTPYESVMNEIEDTEKGVETWITNYNPESYSHAVLIADQTSPLLDLEKNINEFIA